MFLIFIVNFSGPPVGKLDRGNSKATRWKDTEFGDASLNAGPLCAAACVAPRSCAPPQARQSPQAPDGWQRWRHLPWGGSGGEGRDLAAPSYQVSRGGLALPGKHWVALQVRPEDFRFSLEAQGQRWTGTGRHWILGTNFKNFMSKLLNRVTISKIKLCNCTLLSR